MVTIDDAIIARLKTHGEKFEVLVDSDKARKIKQGGSEDDFLAAPNVYKDVGTAELASEDMLRKVFGSLTVEQIAIRIITKGEVHLTSEQRKAIAEDKMNKIVTYICRNAVDPKTGYPHPRSRIEHAIEKINFHIDVFKPSEKQIDDIVRQLRPVIPLRFETRSVAVKVPSQYTGKMYGVFSGFGKLLREEWEKDGSLVALIEIPAGLQNDFYDKLNAVTKGDVEIKILDKR